MAVLQKHKGPHQNKKIIKVGSETRNFVVLANPGTIKAKSPKLKQLNMDLCEVASDHSYKSKSVAKKPRKVTPTPN